MGALILIALTAIVAIFAAKYATRRREAEETEKTYRLATDVANEGFYMIRPICGRDNHMEDFRLDDCNNRAAELVGARREHLQGMKASQLIPETFGNEMLNPCHQALETGFIEEEVRVPPHSPVKARWIYRRIVNADAGLALTVRDISEAKEQEQASADLANNDMLTHLPNRNWLASFLPSGVARAPNHTGHLALLFIDPDNFKNISDTLGHDAGDELLVQAGQRLKKTVRASNHVARLGGDEFVVILDHVEAVEDVARVAQEIVDSIKEPFSLATGTGNDINASIGINLFPQDGTNAETLLKHADIAMYAAKATDKGRYAFYHTHVSDSLILRLDKERALRDAVAGDEFIVHYQPRVDINTGRMTSMEALADGTAPSMGWCTRPNLSMLPRISDLS